MLQIQMRILRVFGLSKAEMTSITDAASQAGCPSLRLQERDGEYLVCVQASAPTQAMADEYCEKWVQKLRTRFGDACYGFEDTTLAQAALQALLKKRRLLVAADETTGRMLGNALRGLEHSEAAFDFGNQTYRNAANAGRIGVPEALLKKFPGDIVQAAAGRAQSALNVANADYAAIYVPATVGQAPFVLLCSRIGAAACAVEPGVSEKTIANNILDLARRRALGLHLGASAITFKPGHDHPLLLVSREGQPRPGSRFTLRRKGEPRPAAQAEPLSAAAPSPAQGTAAVQPAVPDGTITFDPPAPQASAPAPQQTAPDPLGLYTAGPEAAAAARARRRSQTQAPPLPGETRTLKVNRSAPQPAAPQQETHAAVDVDALARRIQSDSLLDREIPDFSAGLDPEAMEAARRADETAPPRSAEEFQRAASRLFDDEDDEDLDEDPTIEFVGNPFSSRPELLEEQPFRDAAPAKPQPKETPAAAPEPQQKPAPEPPTAPKPAGQSTIQNRSLAMIEEAERRHRRNTVLVIAVCAVLAVVCLAVLLWTVGHRGTGVPDENNYGTALFDEQVQNYLEDQENDSVTGYLAFPAQNAQLVYSGSQPGDGAAVAGTDWLDAAGAANTVVSCADGSLLGLTSQANFAQNGEFTLYLGEKIYRCRAAAVYYTDEEFTPTAYGDLSNYYDYLTFTQAVQSRSLFDTGVTLGDGQSFVTLMSTGGENGSQICVTAILQTDEAQMDEADAAQSGAADTESTAG